MAKSDVPLSPPGDQTSRALAYLRKRSQHRVWWDSARVAYRRGPTGKPLPRPHRPSAAGKGV